MSGSLCVCARSLLITDICVASFVRGATIFGYTVAETERAANNQKEIRGITVGRLATGQYGSEY